jgi:hypothetical protein
MYWERHPDPRPLIAIMTRKFEDLARRLNAGHLKDVDAAGARRMASMLVQDVFTHGAYTQSSILRNVNFRNHWWGGRS